MKSKRVFELGTIDVEIIRSGLTHFIDKHKGEGIEWTAKELFEALELRNSHQNQIKIVIDE